MGVRAGAEKLEGKMRSNEGIMDAVLTEEGWTPEQLDESRRMADRYEELRAAGYTNDQIDAVWKGKSPNEILAGGRKAASTPANDKRKAGKVASRYSDGCGE